MSKKYDYLIVGSGLFGATFAYEAKRQGKKCLVLEKQKLPGGAIRTEQKDGIDIHVNGPHVFHTLDEEVWRFVNRFTSFNHFIDTPIARTKDQAYNLPLNMNTFYEMWKTILPSDAKAKIEQTRKPNTNPANLEEAACSTMGKELYELFIKDYAQKLWGMDCKDIPRTYLSRIPLRLTYDNNLYSGQYQGIPTKGYNKLIEALLEDCTIACGCDYNQDRDTWNDRAKHIVYTGPIDELFDLRFGKLAYRNVRYEHELKNTDNYQGTAQMHFLDKVVPYTRSIEHKQYTAGTQPVSWISKEFPCEQSPDTLAYFPKISTQELQRYQQYKSLADQMEHLVLGGRLAQYAYMDMDQTIRSALDLATKEFGDNSLSDNSMLAEMIALDSMDPQYNAFGPVI